MDSAFPLNPPAYIPEIFVISLGCPRNLVDSEVMIGALVKKGFRISYELKNPDIAIVNTCAFIKDARAESIDIITQLAALKKDKKVKKLIVIGCLAARYAGQLRDEIEEIDAVLGVDEFAKIPAYIDRILKGKSLVRAPKKPKFLYDHTHKRILMTPVHSAYIKIQDGCRNFCSYCVIPAIRGAFRSRVIGSVLKEVTYLKSGGRLKEINIIGQDTTLYGIDRYGRYELPKLLRKVSSVMKDGWVRLLYTHPAHYTDELIKTIREERSICRYLDMPIQHINEKILKKMNRHISKKGIISLIEKLRERIPGLALRTSIIVGFPQETDKDFSELLSFMREARFERLGVFIYSREEGTKAFNFKGQVPEKIKKERFKELMKLQREIAYENNKRFLGKRMRVLVDDEDKSSPGHYIGRTEYDAPEVDGNVFVKSGLKLKKGDFVNVKIDGTLEYDLMGTALTGVRA
ncbi:MAG: 30S ribosomal protein S12 methylthiotransferase RimO [Candidatus Omnitrophica bacterium]|nr:30S ribosomal protein S12 methylthiotransferase RimO [Candidatus Omnitrophota bacterium]